jgi:large subunit ribosomal protein L6
MSSLTEKEEGTSFTITVPEGVKLDLVGHAVKVAGPRGAVERELWHPGVQLTKEQSEDGTVVLVRSDSSRKKIRAIAGTYASHLRNMITGVQQGFFFKLAIVHAHFPMQVAVTKEGDFLAVSNFLGERKPRLAKIVPGVKVEVKGRDILVSGLDKEAVGQTAANIEQTTRIKGYDPRVFQDGIYLVDKGVGTGS